MPVGGDLGVSCTRMHERCLTYESCVVECSCSFSLLRCRCVFSVLLSVLLLLSYFGAVCLLFLVEGAVASSWWDYAQMLSPSIIGRIEHDLALASAAQYIEWPLPALMKLVPEPRDRTWDRSWTRDVRRFS